MSDWDKRGWQMVRGCVRVCVLSVTRLRAVAALIILYCSNMSLKMQRLRSQGRFHRYLALLVHLHPRLPAPLDAWTCLSSSWQQTQVNQTILRNWWSKQTTGPVKPVVAGIPTYLTNTTNNKKKKKACRFKAKNRQKNTFHISVTALVCVCECVCVKDGCLVSLEVRTALEFAQTQTNWIYILLTRWHNPLVPGNFS